MRKIYVLFSLIVFFGLAGITNGQTDNVNSESSQTNKPLKIIKKPFAKIRGANCSESSGRISVRVTFDKSAKVTKTEIVTASGCPDFDDNAVRAAQKIKFEPAHEDGVPITVVKIVQYQFNKY